MNTALTHRRQFIRTVIGTSGLAALAPLSTVLRGSTAPAVAIPSATAQQQNILVVIQLTGGNDGLNTLIPFAQDEYIRNRPTLRFTADQVHKINGSLGFHPKMTAFKRLWDQGHLSVIQGVGYPNSDRSHDQALRIWHTARPEAPHCQTGWLGRAADQFTDSSAASDPVAFIGRIQRPEALTAAHTFVPSISSLDTFAPPVHALRDSPLSDRAHNVSLDFLNKTITSAQQFQEQIERAQQSHSLTRYPDFGLATDLCTVAQLIKAETGFRIYYVELGGGGIGGFDNHANQRGNHCALLHQLAESVGAFVDELRQARCLDRTLLMTLSEFGRTVTENGRRGTGHGAAAPLFLAGGKGRKGLIGDHPSLTDLDNDALKHQFDCRQVYDTVLTQWLGLPKNAPENTGPAIPLFS